MQSEYDESLADMDFLPLAALGEELFDEWYPDWDGVERADIPPPPALVEEARQLAALALIEAERRRSVMRIIPRLPDQARGEWAEAFGG